MGPVAAAYSSRRFRASSTLLTTSSTTCSVLKPRWSRKSLASTSGSPVSGYLHCLEAEVTRLPQEELRHDLLDLLADHPFEHLAGDRPDLDQDGTQPALALRAVLLLEGLEERLFADELLADQDVAERLAGELEAA